jgi:outer membrane lipoprotein-sorting protein
MNLRLSRKRALISILTLLIIASCRPVNDSPTTSSAPTEIVVSATPPYQTKEPDRYRATRTIRSITADGKTTVTKNSIARDGEMRRTESEFGSRRLVLLNLPQGTFVLLPDEKVYADSAGETVPGAAEDVEISPEKLLHEETGSTSYQTLGPEMITGRNTNKYRVVVNSRNAANVSQSETLIWIDEALGMPTRSETKSPDGTRVTMELSEIALDVDKYVFRVPDDYEKITSAELRKRLRN